MRRYRYSVVEKLMRGRRWRIKKRYTVYVHAKPSFSGREMKNKISDVAIGMMGGKLGRPNYYVAALGQAYFEFDKAKKVLSLWPDMFMEFACLDSRAEIDNLLTFLKKSWGGRWNRS